MDGLGKCQTQFGGKASDSAREGPVGAVSLTWVWVKTKPPGDPQILAQTSIYQGSIVELPYF